MYGCDYEKESNSFKVDTLRFIVVFFPHCFIALVRVKGLESPPTENTAPKCLKHFIRCTE